MHEDEEAHGESKIARGYDSDDIISYLFMTPSAGIVSLRLRAESERMTTFVRDAAGIIMRRRMSARTIIRQGDIQASVSVLRPLRHLPSLH